MSVMIQDQQLQHNCMYLHYRIQNKVNNTKQSSTRSSHKVSKACILKWCIKSLIWVTPCHFITCELFFSMVPLETEILTILQNEFFCPLFTEVSVLVFQPQDEKGKKQMYQTFTFISLVSVPGSYINSAPFYRKKQEKAR